MVLNEPAKENGNVKKKTKEVDLDCSDSSDSDIDEIQRLCEQTKKDQILAAAAKLPPPVLAPMDLAEALKLAEIAK